MIVWLTSVFLYWTPYPILGTIFLFLCCFFLFILKKSINVKKLLITFFLFIVVVFCSFSASFYFDLDLNYGGAYRLLHFLVLAVFFSIIKVEDIKAKLVRDLILIFVLIALAFYFFGIYFFTESFFYETNQGQLRYEFLLSEPSFFAIFCSILLYLINFHFDFKKNETNFLSIVLIFLILTTASGSGLVLILIWAGLKTGLSFKRVVGFIFLMIIIYFLLPNSTIDFFEHRLDIVMSNELDGSTRIRFIAPLIAISDVLTNSPIFGYGLSTFDSYMLNNYEKFTVFYKTDFHGNLIVNTNIDNVWANIIFSSGILGFLLVFSLLINKLYKKTLPFKTFFFFSVLFCLSGAFIHPLFFGLILGRFELNEK